MNPIFRDLKTWVYVLICAVFKYLIDRRMSSILKANIPPYLVSLRHGLSIVNYEVISTWFMFFVQL